MTAFDTNPFSDPTADPTQEEAPVVDVRAAAMSRLRTPFGVEADAESKAGEPAPATHPES